MRWEISLAFAAVIAGAMPAAAETMTSPPIFGGLSQTNAFCYVVNAGTTAISFQTFELVSEKKLGDSSKGNCVSVRSLQPVQVCQAVFNIEKDKAYFCRVIVGSKANARASLEIRDANSRVLNRADLR